ncbi:MAG: TrbI/VirB10 family protein, partial [Succinivibrionaceae bacterium]
DINTREIGIESMAASLKYEQENISSLKKEIEKLKTLNQNRRKEFADDQNHSSEISRLYSEINELKNKLNEIQEVQKNASILQYSDMAPINNKEENIKKEERENENEIETYEIRKSINSYNSKIPENIKEKSNDNKNLEHYIPSGSMLSGVLITGLDAPTRQDAKNDPFPVLITLNKDAILPNSNFFNVKECFLIAAGFGDMSSERVYLRSEHLSCVTKNKKVIEVPINAYATGEDGKAGVRGRVVSKQGRLIARSLMAGFFEGLSGAFDVEQVPLITTENSSNSMDYKRVYNSMALEGAVVKGSSKALEQLSSFYLKLAQQMFPVIELDASRKIDLVVTKGFSIPYALDE